MIENKADRTLVSREVYDSRGNVEERILCRNSLRIQFLYDEKGRVRTSSDSEGTTTIWIYDEEGLLQEVTKNGVAETKYYYDDAGRCIREEYTGKGWKSFHYGDRDLLVRERNHTGWERHFIYDAKGLKVLEISGYATEDGVFLSDDLIVEHWRHDEMGRPILFISSRGSIATWEYDGHGNNTKCFNTGMRTTNEYDEADRLVHTWHSDGREYWYRYKCCQDGTVYQKDTFSNR